MLSLKQLFQRGRKNQVSGEGERAGEMPKKATVSKKQVSDITKDEEKISREILEAAVRELLHEREHSWSLASLILGPVCASEPITNVRKRQQQAKMMMLILVPFFTLLSVAIYLNTDSIHAMVQAEQTKRTVEFSVYVGRLIVVLQKEQDQSALYLSSIGPETKFFLTQTYMQTDLYLEQLPYWPEYLDRSDRKFFSSKKAFLNYLWNHRNRLGVNNMTMYDEILFYKESIDVFLIWLYDALKESRYSNLWKTLVAYQKVIFCGHYAGIERALGTTYFVEGGFYDPYLYIKYNEVVYVFKNNFEAAMKYSPLVKPISSAQLHGENITDITDVIEQYRDQIQFQNITGPSLHDASIWFDYMSTYLDILFQFQTELANDILQILNERSVKVMIDVASSTFVIFVVFITLPVTLRALQTLTNDIQSYAIALAMKMQELEQEKKKGDVILEELIPKPVVECLRRRQRANANYYQEVTILYAQLSDFNELGSELDATTSIGILDKIFTRCDEKIMQFDAYKVEAIGVSFLVVSGLPRTNDRRHATEIANVALALMQVPAEVLAESEMDSPLLTATFRAAMCTGPVIAGVVGERLPRYCLFGDTVGNAAKLERQGMSGRTLVASATQKFLSRQGFIMEPFNCKKREGAWVCTSYWLLGKHQHNRHGNRNDM